MVLQECRLEWTRNKLKRDCKVELRVMLTISRSMICTTRSLKLTILTKDGLLPVTALWLYENIFNLFSMSWLLSIFICSKWMTCTQADMTEILLIRNKTRKQSINYTKKSINFLFLAELCMRNLNLLNTYGMITMDEETIDVKSTGASVKWIVATCWCLKKIHRLQCICYVGEKGEIFNVINGLFFLVSGYL